MPSHKRKAPEEKTRGPYPRWKLLKAVKDVLSGNLSVPEAKSTHTVPTRTIRRYVK